MSVWIDFFNKEELVALEPVLMSWLQVQKDYHEISQGDLAYWYTERASVSTLSAAAWRTKDWIAIEEYQREKNTKSGVGRCDLWMGKRGVMKNSFEIEVKQIFVEIPTDLQKDRGPLQTKWCEACDATAALSDIESYKRVAALFVVTWCKSAPVEQVPITDELLRKFCKKNNVHAIAKFGPLDYEKTYLSKPDQYKAYYPSVYLLLKEVNANHNCKPIGVT